jgi:hypothetical protein
MHYPGHDLDFLLFGGNYFFEFRKLIRSRQANPGSRLFPVSEAAGNALPAFLILQEPEG